MQRSMISILTILIICSLSAQSNALYSASSPVLQLTPSNFKSKVLSSLPVPTFWLRSVYKRFDLWIVCFFWDYCFWVVLFKAKICGFSLFKIICVAKEGERLVRNVRSFLFCAAFDIWMSHLGFIPQSVKWRIHIL